MPNSANPYHSDTQMSHASSMGQLREESIMGWVKDGQWPQGPTPTSSSLTETSLSSRMEKILSVVAHPSIPPSVDGPEVGRIYDQELVVDNLEDS